VVIEEKLRNARDLKSSQRCWWRILLFETWPLD